MARVWKKGRGRLGFLDPLLGTWVAEADSEMGRVKCTRTLAPVLGGAYVRLTARWEFGAGGPEGKVYEEIALIGVGDEKKVRFWSFTSDGKRSEGVAADVTDLHDEAVGFEADMPHGRARLAYWPEEEGFIWLVQAKTARGWRDIVQHRYRPATDS